MYIMNYFKPKFNENINLKISMSPNINYKINYESELNIISLGPSNNLIPVLVVAGAELEKQNFNL